MRSLIALAAALSVSGAPPGEPPRPRMPAFVERDVSVPMRDGVRLQADVLRPAASGRFPTLVYRTPYDRKRSEDDPLVASAVARGYAVVLQDVRGRYGSGGEFTPYVHEGRDGFDTIGWAASQPWSSGDVGTFGLSYPGAVQWLAAMEAPPHLKAMVPAMTFSHPGNFFYAGGAWDLSWLPWIWNSIAPDARARTNLAGPRTGREAREAWKALSGVLPFRLPLTDVPELRDAAPYYFEWLARRPGEPWWSWADLRGRYGRVTAAVLSISGWHDEAYGPEGAMTNFLGLVAARPPGADPRAELILGPWVHGGETEDRSGERVFGPQARLDYVGEVLRFMDRHVRGRKAPAAVPRVRAFVMGENAWRSGDTLPLPGTKRVSLYLTSGGRLDFRPPASDAPSAVSEFLSDPARPVVDPYGAAAGAHDYRELARRPDVLVFETGPLSEPVRVVGAVETEIFASSEAPDFDLWVKLQDVAPDGTAWNLSSPGTDVLRASERGRGADAPPSLLDPGEVAVMRFPNLRTGNLFGRGHRIRVVLCGSFMPHFSRNLQTGESETLSARSRPARIRIHHDSARASRLVLPVVAP